MVSAALIPRATRHHAALVATLFVALGITACGKKDAEPADTATWMYGDQGVSEADEMLTSSGGVNVSEFHISKETPWPAGSYTVDVKLNGQPVGTREFRIQ
ncbi:MAG: hypothetical protein WEA80_06650 [Gemmatimonadaceae bacterium]